MRKTLLLPLMALLLITCQKEENIQQASPSTQNSLHPKTFKTPEDVFSFLSQEMPEVYTPEEINRVQNLLEEPDNQGHERSGHIVELPAGSVNALQDAVDEAGPGGTVLVKAGEHTENGMVKVSHQINIIGEDGSVLIIDNSGINTVPGQVMSGIWLLNADKTTIKNLQFSTNEEVAFAAILVQNSNRVRITGNQFSKFILGILIQNSDFAFVGYNHITTDGSWQSGGPNAVGITVINGRSASVIDNVVNNALFGIWACDRGGVSWGNETYGNLYGQILCKVPSGGLNDPNGAALASVDPGNRWLVALNESRNNFYGGIVVIDGANNNTLLANSGSGNGAYDVDLVGNTERFAFFTPTSIKNTVYSYNNQMIKDCGENNRVIGGTHVDTSVDPCDNVDPE